MYPQCDLLCIILKAKFTTLWSPPLKTIFKTEHKTLKDYAKEVTLLVDISKQSLETDHTIVTMVCNKVAKVTMSLLDSPLMLQFSCLAAACTAEPPSTARRPDLELQVHRP